MRSFSCSVVLPVYNKEATVGRAIDSVLAQSVLPEKVIVVDDGSLDGTTQVLDKYRDSGRFKIVRLPENQGVSEARNTGVRLAESEWVAFLDADDFWERDFIEQCQKLICTHSETDLVGTGYSFHTRKRKIEGRFPLATSEHCPVRDYFEWAATGDLPFTCSSTIVKRSLLNEVKGFDPDLSMGEDQVVWLKLLQSGTAFFLNQSLATYDLTHSSAVSGLSHRLKDPVYLDAMLEVVSRKSHKQSPYMAQYFRRVCRSTLVYQSAYLGGNSVREFLKKHKANYLSRLERSIFWLLTLLPTGFRNPVFRFVIRRFNKKWN